MKILFAIMGLLAISTTALGGLEYKKRVDLERYSRISAQIANVEFVDCKDQEYQAYEVPGSTKPISGNLHYELKDALRYQRVTDSFLRQGIKNPDCLSITIVGNTRSVGEQADAALNVIDQIFQRQERLWRIANEDQLDRQERGGSLDRIRVDNPNRRGVYCSGVESIGFSKKIQMWSVNFTPERSNRRDLTFVFALEAKGKDQMIVTGGYGCRFVGETKKISDIKLFGDFKDLGPLYPKEDQVTFDQTFLD